MRGMKRRMPALFVITVVLFVSVLGLLYKGMEVTHVDVDDGGIWVIDKSKQMVGHLNYDARVLDGALRAESANFDIGQAGETVTMTDRATSTIAPINVTAVALGSATPLPSGAVATQGGDTLGVYNPAEGTFWVTSAKGPVAADLGDGAALDSGEGAGASTVAVDGTAFSLSASDGTLVTVAPKGTVQSVNKSRIKGIDPAATLAMTAVGNHPVAFDTTGNILYLPNGQAYSLTDYGIAPGAVLQQPGADADSVYLATPTSLVGVPLKGGEPSVVDTGASGSPAAPVWHMGCAYGAWSGSGAYLRSCADPSKDTNDVVDTLKSAREVVFRTNRSAIVLNDVALGSVWLPDENMTIVDNWDEVEQQLAESEEEEQTTDLIDEVEDPERKEQNTPPDAEDDEFGVRPGRSTLLTVLDNDSDSDGDVLTARATSSPGFGTIVSTRGGRALQITDVADSQTGSTSFTYEASDGQDTDSATVRVSVHPWSENAAPEQRTVPTVKIGQGAQIQYNVLGDWRDPDGDQVFLQDAQAPEGLSVQFAEDGTLQIRELGAGAGPKTVDLTVSDGRAQGKGTLKVDVQEPGNQAPSANADFYVAREGETITLDPLANDTDPNGDPLRLVGISASASVTALPDLEAGTIDFTATAQGTYQFSYTVTDGADQKIGIIRVDVIPADEASGPIAEDDLAVLPAGGSVLVAPLGNDTDPSGGVLVVQSVDVPADSGLEVALLDRHLLRVSSPAGIGESVSFTYTVSNGYGSATARVLVVPGSETNSSLPPVLQPDTVKVRVGDVGTASVLDNDRSPGGLSLSVEPTLNYEANPSVGTPFVTGNEVRIEAGGTPGTLSVVYSVIDSSGNTAASTVTFEVVPDSEANNPPRPKALTAWAASKQTTRIPVPLAGVDPDGDSVWLVGTDQQPTKGTAVVRDSWLEYTPAEGTSGTEVFTYVVEDRRGARGTARVRVGIAPPASLNQNPAAVPDTVLVRPGRQVSVNVLANDVDPDGDPLALDADGLTASDPRLAPTASGDFVTITTPEAEGTYLVSYGVSDGRGGSSRGQLTAYVSANAPLKAPIARDDALSFDRLPSDGSAARVRVTENDEDPDGSVSDLVVTTSDPGVVVDGQDLLITPQASRRLVVYTVTDSDSLSNSAVVSVPGLDSTPPTVRSEGMPIEMKAGESRTLALADYTTVRPGRSARLSEGGSIVSSNGIDQAAANGEGSVDVHAREGFSGSATVSLDVSDGSSNDSGTLSARLSLTFIVRPASNQPPTLTPTPIRVGAGEDPVTQNLALAVTDPDGANPRDFAYALVSKPDSVSASVSGTALTVSAPAGTATGAAGSIVVSVDDGSGPVQASVPVEVVSTTKPKMQVSAIRRTVESGGSVTVDVASESVIGAIGPVQVVDSGPGVAAGSASTVTWSGTSVTIKPDPAKAEFTYQYSITDAPGDSSRTVSNTITVKVRQTKPAAPVSVRAVSRGGAQGVGAAELLITDANLGADFVVKGYRVTDVNTGTGYDCEPQMRCLVSPLGPGPHSFTAVVRTNKGDSAPSAPSNTLDFSPDPSGVRRLQVTPGNGSLTANWSAPDQQGSGIVNYEVAVTGSGGGTEQVPASPTWYTRSGLTPGESYTVSVVAIDTNSRRSAAVSTRVTLPSAPEPPRDLKAMVVGGTGDGTTSFNVTWKLGSHHSSGWANGTVSVDSRPYPVSPGATQKEVSVPSGGSATITVTVFNADGYSNAASISVSTLVKNPLPPTAPVLKPTGNTGELQVVGLAKVPGNGYEARQLTLRYARSEAACAAGDEVEDGEVIGGLGASSTPVTLFFCQTATAVDATKVVSSATSASGTPKAGNVPKFKVKAKADGTSIKATWNIPADADIVRAHASIKEGGVAPQYGSPPPTSAVFSGLAPLNRYTVVVTLTNASGAERTVEKEVWTEEDPQYIEEVWEGLGSCWGTPCGTFRISATRADQFAPDATLTCYVYTYQDEDHPRKRGKWRLDAKGNWRVTGLPTQATSAGAFAGMDQHVTSCWVEDDDDD